MIFVFCFLFFCFLFFCFFVFCFFFFVFFFLRRTMIFFLNQILSGFFKPHACGFFFFFFPPIYSK